MIWKHLVFVRSAVLAFFVTVFFMEIHARHQIIPGSMPYDGYHYLHLPHNPPLYPTYSKVPRTKFSCQKREFGYHADVDTACQVYHLCNEQYLQASFLCTNGTLFNEQFQVCDQFYNVRCGSPYIDL